MSPSPPPHVRQVLIDKLADSIERPIRDSTERRVFGDVEFRGKASAVIGMRRSGKTTFLHQRRAARIDLGAPQTALPYLNFEDERLAGLEAGQLNFLLEEYERRVPTLPAGTVPLWSFDEIQVVPGWERFVRRLLDSESCEVIVTGSSAALLSREIATALRGRAWEVPIFPFSFEESLRHAGHKVPMRVDRLTSRERRTFEQNFEDWLVVGGFPEAQGLGSGARFQLLRDYVDVVILRDVMERHGASNLTGLRWLVRHLLGNAASLFSVEKLFAALKSQGLAISKDTVHQLVDHLEDCFLVRFVWMESKSERQRMVNPRKAYPVDPGLIPVFDRSGKSNVGHALETAVLIELQRRRHEVTYVRTPSGYEVDFLARGPEGNIELIQVCADASDTETAERELRALEDVTAYPAATKRLLTLRADLLPSTAPAGVVVQTASEWMLE